jgi:hypothetical protein
MDIIYEIGAVTLLSVLLIQQHNYFEKLKNNMW